MLLFCIYIKILHASDKIFWFSIPRLFPSSVLKVSLGSFISSLCFDKYNHMWHTLRAIQKLDNVSLYFVCIEAE